MAFVRMPTNQLIVHVVDASGKHATSQYFVDDGEVDPDSGGPAAIAAAVQGMSNGLVYQVEILMHAVNDAPGAGTTGNFARVMDKMKLTFNTLAGSAPIMQIPAPVDGILASDGVKIDPTDAAVIALVNGLVADGTDAEGEGIVGLQNGFRRWPAGLKKY